METTALWGNQTARALAVRLEVMGRLNVKKASIITTACLFILLAITACSSPVTKESYLKQFSEFISSIENSDSRDAPDFWVTSQEQYDRFSSEWYGKFKPELTWSDELSIAQLRVRYTLLRSAAYARDLARGARLEYAQAREQLQFYIENNMQADIDRMMETIRTSSAMVESEIEALEREFSGTQKPQR